MLLSFDNFEQIFMSAKRPYWWMYQGKGKAGAQIGSNTEVGDLADSWAQLSNLINLYGDGVYTVETRSHITSAKGQHYHTFAYGNPDLSAAAPQPAQVGFIAPPRVAAPTTTPENNPFYKGLDMKYWVDRVDTLQDKLRRVEMELLTANQKMYLMKQEARMAEQPDGMTKVLGFLEKQPALVAGLANLFTGQPQPTAIGTLRKEAKVPPPVVSDDEDYDEDEDETYAAGMSIDRLVASAYRIAQAMQDVDVNELLEKVAAVAESDPGKLRTALKFL